MIHIELILPYLDLLGTCIHNNGHIPLILMNQILKFGGLEKPWLEVVQFYDNSLRLHYLSSPWQALAIGLVHQMKYAALLTNKSKSLFTGRQQNK